MTFVSENLQIITSALYLTIFNEINYFLLAQYALLNNADSLLFFLPTKAFILLSVTMPCLSKICLTLSYVET